MYFLRICCIFFLCEAMSGCLPSSEGDDFSLPRIYDTVGFKANVSRLFGDGGKTVKDNTGTLASNIIWKDSLGATHSLKELGGEVIVLNMWASWCGPCRDEMPALQEIANEYTSSGLRMIGISIDRAHEPFRSVLEFAKDYGVNYQLIVDSTATAYINYGGNGDIPWTYIIDRDGYIQYSFHGQASKEQLIEAIETLL
jgi:thiol-disulfide isomerase/thioredoxin